MLKLKKIYNSHILITAVIAISLLSCNKDLPVAEPIVQSKPVGPSIMSAVRADASFSLLRTAITRAGAGITATLSDSTGVFTFFAPTDAAFQMAGFTSAAIINAQRPGLLDTMLRYHLVPGQKLTSDRIPTSFPNIQVPTAFVLASPSATLPPGLRMPIFPSKRGTNLWANNVPVTQADIQAENSVIHKVAAIILPPSQLLWDRINTDTELTYLKAAIQRSDSGVVAASTLQAALQNAAASLTVFAPVDSAFRQLLTGQITLALMAQGMDAATAQATATSLASTPAVFTNPALSGVLTPTTVRGIVVYHLLGVRAFTVNFPTTATNIPTLLNSAIAAHPGVSLVATFGATGVTAATVKGLGNATPSNLLINPTPAPGGSSDQHYINGVLHKINQVLLPQ